MYKFYLSNSKLWGKETLLFRVLLMMKLITLGLLLGMMHLHANSLGQTLHLQGKQIKYRALFKEIRKQTGYDFLMHATHFNLNKKVDVNFSNVALHDVLVWLKEKENINVQLKGHSIIVFPKDKLLATGFSQEFKTIMGTVMNSKGQALAGVTIIRKGTSNSTATNEQGQFTLSGIRKGDLIELRLLGYAGQEFKVNDQNTYTILMLEQDTHLDEVVVSTGLQTLNPERVSGSFGYVGQEQLSKPSTNIAQRLIGTTAGMQATLDESGNPVFEIRGQSSLNGIAAPLVVVDGFAIQGDFNTINPNDVENITILKDAAAASIWGARAANGVIVVTTKKGAKGTPIRVDLQVFRKIGSKIDLDYTRPLASSAMTIDYEKLAFNKWGALENSGDFRNNYNRQWSPATVLLSEHYLGYINDAQLQSGLDALKAQENKSQIADELLANPISDQINLSVSGSTGKINNYFSMLAERNQTDFKESKSDKYLMNYRATAGVFNWLDLHLSSTLHLNNSQFNGVTLDQIQSWAPYEMLRNPDGSLSNLSQYYWPIMERFVPMDKFPYADWTFNPIQEINSRDLSTKDVNLRVIGGITLKPIKGLTYDAKIQYELFNSERRNWYGEQSHFVRDMINRAASWDRTSNVIRLNLPKGDVLDQNRSKDHTWNFRNQLSFNRDLTPDHSVNAIVGSEVQSYVSEYFGNPRTYGYNDETLRVGTFPNGPGGTFFTIRDWIGQSQNFPYTNAFGYTSRRYFSLYANAAYTFKNKYTLTGSIRTDASNLITDDPSYRYSPFWSVGGAWQLGREQFMQPYVWVNKLNLRLTYGYNGNVDLSTGFRPLIAMSASPNIYTNDYIANISSFGNPNLRWEKTGSWNLGIDYALFNHKLYGKIDLYHKYGSDLLADISIPSSNGTTRQKLNSAEMLNKGIELEIGTDLPIHGEHIRWRGALNFSYNHNRIEKLFVANFDAGSLSYGGSEAYVEGHNANSLWMFEYAGMQDGQPMIYGQNGTKLDFTNFPMGDAREFMSNKGTLIAPYTLGFNSSFKIYDFDLSFILTGKLGHVFKKYSFNYPPLWTGRLLPNNKLGEVMNADPSLMVPLPQNDDEFMYFFWEQFFPYMSYLSTNASHIRLQELSLAYRLPTDKWISLRNTRASVFLQGNDLFTKVFNNKGEDPEYQMGTVNPRPKFTIGFNMSF